MSPPDPAATGLTATGSADIAEVAYFHSGAFAFDGSSAVRITGPFGGGRDAGGACINVDGGAPVDRYVLLRGGGVGAKRAEVSLPTLAPGLHRITATFWAAGENATCAKRTLAAVGVLQVASAIYEVADDVEKMSILPAWSACSVVCESSMTLNGRVRYRNGAVDMPMW